MPIKLANNASGQIATGLAPYDIGLALVAGQGATFPSLAAGEYFYATLASAGGSIEIVKVTAKVNDTFTIVRAQEGTTALSFSAGARFELRVTAQSVRDAIDDVTASAVGFTPTGGLAATDVQAAIVEVVTDLAASGGAAAVGFTPTGGLAATDVQAAISELEANTRISALPAATLPLTGAELVPVVQGGVTKQTTSVKLKNVVSVRDFGAVGDGVTNDTVAIQSALDSGAKRIYVPAGTYLVKNSADVLDGNVLVLPNNITLYGDGATSVIKLGAHTTQAHRVLRVVGRTNVTIQDLCVDGDKVNQTAVADEQSHCVLILDSTNVSMLNCVLKNAKGDGLYFGGTTNPGAVNLLIDGCAFDGNVRQGISGVRGEYVRIVNNDIANTTGSAPGAGIDLEANNGGDTLRQIVISGNTIRGNFWGVFVHELAPAREITIDGNTFYLNRTTDIFCRGRNVTISNNSIRASGKTSPGAAIDISLASNITVVGNSIAGDYTDTNERGGIRVQRGCSNIVVANNSISATALTAISLVTASLSGGPSNSISVIGNTMLDCVAASSTAPVMNLQPENGGAADITNVVIRDNVIRDTRSGGDEADLGLRLVNSTAAQLATWFIENNIFTGVVHGVTSVSGWEFAAGTLVARAALNFDLTSVTYQDLTVTVTGAVLGDIVSLGIPPAAAVADVVYCAWVSAADTVTVRAARVGGTPNPASGQFNVCVTKLMTHA